MSALRSAAKPENPITDLCSDLQERALEQHSVAMLLRALFLSMADDDDGPLHHYKEDLWEGLAVIARHISNDGKEISNMRCAMTARKDRVSVRPEAPQLPASLRLLLRALKLTRPDALATALPFARAMLSDMNLDDPDGHVGEFLEAYHKKGSIYARVVESSDGDIAVAFTEPGVVLGIALAYVLLTACGGVQ